MDKPKFALVCASNQNRSMSGHLECKKYNLNVKSYGSGNKVKLPGKTKHEQHVYAFGTPYEKMINDLKDNDEKFYQSIGIIGMLERNMGIKIAPEKFQLANEWFDVVFCFDERVLEQVIHFYSNVSSLFNDTNEYEMNNITNMNKPVYLINLSVKDNHAEAKKASLICANLLKLINDDKDWQANLETITNNYQKERKIKFDIIVLFP